MELDQAYSLLNNSKNLNDLLDNICAARQELDQDDLAKLDLTSLPNFGGKEPRSTLGVWSWDDNNLLVGEGNFEIVSRDE